MREALELSHLRAQKLRESERSVTQGIYQLSPEFDSAGPAETNH